MNFHQVPSSELYNLLNTSKKGLNPEDVDKRQLKFGKNELTDRKKKTILGLLLHQFKDVMIFILFAAAIISIAVGDVEDAIVILIIVVLNAIIGFVQEYRAEKAIDALKKMTSFHAMVRRNGKIHQISATELVPGDVVLLDTGMLVPADIRLTESHSLKIQEASLTGESQSVEKNTFVIADENVPLGERFNMAYKTTIVKYGRGEGIVVATGMNTEIGIIAKMLKEDETKTPLQKRLANFGKKLSVAVIIICVIIYGAGLLRGEEPIRMLLTAISLAVAAIPEALPAVITIALALGANRMTLKNVLIRKLPAVETLGSVTFICSDKTGTITENKMTVTDIWIAPDAKKINEFTLDQTLLLSIELNHDVVLDEDNQLNGDPTEVALVEYSRNNNNYDLQWLNNFERYSELPFDSNRKLMTTIYPFNGKWLIVSKGAVENILTICKNTNTEEIISVTEEYAKKGKRILGFALKITDELPQAVTAETIEYDLIFTGLTAMIDPPREETIQAIADCHTAGITPVMITGDHLITAKAIATETGILRFSTDRIITGAELSKLSKEEFEKEIEYIKVYARVSPEQKLNIVTALQNKNQYVAMTGDGVNDAPALRKSDIGIAMGISGTDVSKEAADMILLDDNFATIIIAVREGRRIFDNIQKFIKYTMTSNTGEIWTILLAPLIGLPIPLLPIHILWINLVTDGLPGLAFVAEPAEENILKKPPRKPNANIFGNGMGIHIFWVGLLMGLVCIATQSWSINSGNNKWMTMVFTVLSISQMGHTFAIRSSWKSIFSMEIFGNMPLVFAVLLTLCLQLSVIYIPFLQDIFRTQPLSFFELLLCIGLSSIVFWAVEIEKKFKRRKHKKKELKN